MGGDDRFHDRALRAFRSTFNALAILLALRYATGDKLPALRVLVRMSVALFAVILVLEVLEADASQAVVGVARAATASHVMGMMS